MKEFIAQINLGKLTDKDYLFEAMPPAHGLYQYLSILFGLILVAAIVLFWKARKAERIWQNLYVRTANLCLFSGLAGLLFIFFRYEGLIYLGSRFFLALLAAVALVWGLELCWHRFRIIPPKIQAEERKRNFEKYLP